MARRALTPCRVCKELTRLPRGLCAAHQQASTWGGHHKGRTVTEQGYGHAWRKIRKRILERDNYLCQMCLPDRVHEATHVDHRVPKHQGGTDDEANLWSLNEECHRMKTAKERIRRDG